ncbi:MAG: ATPase [Schumannella sp.]|nr:ATPase [Schumannella sp.]
MSLAEEPRVSDEQPFVDVDGAVRDIGEVPAVELINTVAVHLMSAAAVKLGLGDGPDAAAEIDLDESRKLITSLAGLIVAAAPEISDSHARPLRDGLRSLQLAFREASPIPDPVGKGPGEKWTGPVT